MTVPVHRRSFDWLVLEAQTYRIPLLKATAHLLYAARMYTSERCRASAHRSLSGRAGSRSSAFEQIHGFVRAILPPSFLATSKSPAIRRTRHANEVVASASVDS